MKYLFPCPCGRKIAIEPRQAGETFHCECGLDHRAPSMLQIKTLPPAQTSEPKASFEWGLSHGLLFAGGLLLLLSLAMLATLAWQWPARLKLGTTSEQLQAYSRSLPLAASVRFYREHIANGIDGGGLSNPLEKGYEERVMQSEVALILLIVLTLIATALIGSGVWWMRQRTK